MSNLQASSLLARLERVDVPPDLMRDVLHAHAQSAVHGSGGTLSALISGRISGRVGVGGVSGHHADIVLAAKARILSLACLVRDHVLDEWVRRDDPNGIVLFHKSLFLAAAAEPLILLPNGDIGFDPQGLRRRVLELTAVQGSA
jgi:hypothetical protein